MSLTIRAAQISDSESIATLTNQLGYPTTYTDLKIRLNQILENPEHIVFVGLINGSVAGWIHAWHTYRIESEAFVEIAGLVVDSQYRRKGIARKLVEQVRHWALSNNYGRKLRVRCNTKRTESHRFYANMGFIHIKDQKVFDWALN